MTHKNPIDFIPMWTVMRNPRLVHTAIVKIIYFLKITRKNLIVYLRNVNDMVLGRNPYEIVAKTQ